MVVLQGSKGGLSAKVPTAVELRTAQAFAVNSGLSVNPVDLNYDGYVDRIVTGLKSVDADAAGYVIFAPGAGGGSEPLGLTAMDDTFHQFSDDLAESFEDATYWAENMNLTVRHIYQVGVRCSLRHSIGYPDLWPACYPVLVRVGTILVPAPSFSLDALAAKTVIDKIIAAQDATDGVRLFELSKAFKRVIGVHLLGFQEDGTRLANPHDDVAPSDQPVWQFMNLLAQMMGWMRGDDPGTWHEFEVRTLICKPNPSHTPSYCTVENLWCWLKKYAAPVYGELGNTFENEDEFEVFGSNPIQVFVDDDERVLYNVTQEGHIFHNPSQSGCPEETGEPLPPLNERCAQTRRENAVRTGGGIEVVTKGTGTGGYSDMNEDFGPYVFRSLDGAMIDKLRKPVVKVVGEDVLIISDANSEILECTDN